MFTATVSTTVKEVDLAVTMNANMEVPEQCTNAASQGIQVIGMIRKIDYYQT